MAAEVSAPGFYQKSYCKKGKKKKKNQILVAETISPLLKMFFCSLPHTFMCVNDVQPLLDIPKVLPVIHICVSLSFIFVHLLFLFWLYLLDLYTQQGQKKKRQLFHSRLFRSPCIRKDFFFFCSQLLLYTLPLVIYGRRRRYTLQIGFPTFKKKRGGGNRRWPPLTLYIHTDWASKQLWASRRMRQNKSPSGIMRLSTGDYISIQRFCFSPYTCTYQKLASSYKNKQGNNVNATHRAGNKIERQRDGHFTRNQIRLCEQEKKQPLTLFLFFFDISGVMFNADWAVECRAT